MPRNKMLKEVKVMKNEGGSNRLLLKLNFPLNLISCKYRGVILHCHWMESSIIWSWKILSVKFLKLSKRCQNQSEITKYNSYKPCNFKKEFWGFDEKESRNKIQKIQWVQSQKPLRMCLRNVGMVLQ